MDDEDRTVAASYLQDCREMIVDPILQGAPQLKVTMKGVDIMNDDPLAVDVLYGKVESEELQQIANGIADYFVERGFIQQSHENVKLHVTLINSLFLSNDDAIEKYPSPTQEQRSERITFDASKILKEFKDFHFGSITIQEIHLSQRYSKGSNGYYEATGILKL
jgi:activating signal cointegrator complex subunit 1